MMITIIESYYDKADLKQVDANKVHLNADERIKLLSLLNEFE